ncbi:MAG TPA: YraN family protein [Dietzia timorensis]|uniref:UPF0102 protein K8V11_13315 n=1 Tax=Dietzia timorensis TaxID=499555 RepID=A0A921F6V0_9ACTN|nr:YraN family protein [Dietzia timorensis]HJE91978.1 YraN family protein [Dietzia timorensis]
MADNSCDEDNFYFGRGIATKQPSRPTVLHSHPDVLGPDPLTLYMPWISRWKKESWPQTRSEVGRFGEDLVAELAGDLGFETLGRNWRCPSGELDLIVRGADEVIRFVEVRTRTGPRYGTPAESVIPSKLARLRRLGGAWLAAHRDFHGDVAFDAVAVEKDGEDEAKLTWLWNVL